MAFVVTDGNRFLKRTAIYYARCVDWKRLALRDAYIVADVADARRFTRKRDAARWLDFLSAKWRVADD